MIPKRISVKLFAEEAGQLELSPFISVFHRWIRDETTDHLLIDVADYRHVRHGPGVMLVGHEGDYAIDMGDDRPGLLFTFKRVAPQANESGMLLGLFDLLHYALRSLLKAAVVLQQEPELAAGFSLNPDIIEISLLDRLRSPNTPHTAAAVSDVAKALAVELYPDGHVHVDTLDLEPWRAPVVHLHGAGAESVAVLLKRLEGVPA